MRSVAATADFPVIGHVSDTKVTEVSHEIGGRPFLPYKQFGKGILNQIKMLLTKFYFIYLFLFYSTLCFIQK